MQPFFVDNYRIDVTHSQLSIETEAITIEPKVLQVLLLLAKNQGQVVSHQTILQTVWPDVVVAPNAVPRYCVLRCYT
jgi:DNA-binding winged helix-turn-helix (wHTH) protein